MRLIIANERLPNQLDIQHIVNNGHHPRFEVIEVNSVQYPGALRVGDWLYHERYSYEIDKCLIVPWTEQTSYVYYIVHSISITSKGLA